MRAEFVIKFWANLPGIAYRLRDSRGVWNQTRL